MQSYDRRSVLRGLAGVGVVGIAGCNGGQSGPETGTSTAASSSNGTTATATGTPGASEGGAPAFHYKLTADDPGENDDFGWSVDVDGDTAVVGAHLADESNERDAGAAYVFRRAGEAWRQQAKLVAEDAGLEDRFGSAIAVSGSTVMVGAMSDDDPTATDAGSVYVFERGDGSWSQVAKLAAGDGGRFDGLGESMALDGDTALVGAAGHAGNNGNDAGAVYVFNRIGGSWSQVDKLAPLLLDRADFFGRSVALDGGTALVGAPTDEDPNGAEAGAVYQFQRSGGSWERRGRIVPDDGGTGARFGTSVALVGNRALVGAPYNGTDADEEVGAAYVFERAGDGWTQRAKLLANDDDDENEDDDVASDADDADDRFGHSVALAGNVAAVAAPYDDHPNGLNSGTVAFFHPGEESWTRRGTVAARHGVAEDTFGWSIAMTEAFALIGTPQEDLGAGRSAGAAHLYTP